MITSTAFTFVFGILLLGVLVFVHELGHFLVAKFCRVGVVEFALGFGKILWSIKYNRTRYSIRLIPLGGFVRMVGSDPSFLEGPSPSSDDKDSIASYSVDPDEAELEKDPNLWFMNKGFWAKSAIVVAGPLFNLLFALILAIGMFAVAGDFVPKDEPIIGAVNPTMPAAKAGLLPGDKVLTVDSIPVATWTDFSKLVRESKTGKIQLQIERVVEGTSTKKDVLVEGVMDPPELKFIEGEQFQSGYRIGLVAQHERKPIPFLQAVQYGTMSVWNLSIQSIRGLYGIATGHISPKTIGGPIFIFQEAGRSAREGADNYVTLGILLSITLAILNLLPVPILDGGHLLFFILEAINGRRLGNRFYQYANQLGMILLLLLMVFAFGNDITRLIKGS